MLDINLLRKDRRPWSRALEARVVRQPQPFLDVPRFQSLEAERKAIQTRTEELQAQRNSLSEADRPAQGQGQGHRRADGGQVAASPMS